jgi:hypothetical protein
MDHKYFSNTPFKLSISFHLLIKHYEEIAANQTGYPAEHARLLLQEIEPYPELKNGITHIDELANKSEVLKRLLADLFPEALTDNEIKAVSVPFQNFVFNTSRRFQKILNGAGPAFDIAIRDFSDHQVYVMSCCIILGDIYDVHFDFSRPFFYDIPTATGVMKHYRILYNADFMEVIPNNTAVPLTPEDIDQLRDNFDDIDLWKRLFPVDSYTLKGFALINLFDATIENAVSALKGTLLSSYYDKDEADVNNVKDSIQHVFRSIFKIPDLRVGFTTFNPDENTFSAASFNKQLHSYLLDDMNEASFAEMLCVNSMNCVVADKDYFAVSDVKALLEKEPGNVLAQRFDKQGIQSFILAPIVKDGNMLGIAELVSNRPKELNSINANTLEIVMPYIVDTIDRQYANLQNQIRAIIQNEYTTIHPSVYWKFRREAIKAIDYRHLQKDYALKEITFKNVYPLYGQIDIKGSSETRNLSIQLDLENQLAALIPLVENLNIDNVDLTDEIGELKALSNNLHVSLRADTEQYIQNFLEVQIHPLFKDSQSAEIANYLLQAEKTGEFHHHRRKYETTVTLINEKMSLMLDKWQVEAQQSFPHYYERFKTDGVEHNLYIGGAIAPNRSFSMADLYNLRLWQLQVLCEMELEHYYLKPYLPYPLEVTSLILAFSLPMSIRFRMDEKRFDVDGTYNARFEIVKKRIDKAFIKNTTDRLTSVGKLTIVYSNHNEEVEYKEYIRFLQSKKMLDSEVEMLEVEDLQGISGLRALRVKICYNTSLPVRKCYNYSELVSDTNTAELQGA